MKIKHFALQSLFFTTLFFTTSPLCRAPASAEKLPDIDAREFQLKPLEMSHSGRIYRFKAEGDLPKTGNIILILVNNRPTMAFRVLKTDPVGNELIARRVRRYDVESKLDFETSYQAAEKVADLVSPPGGDGLESAPPPSAETGERAPEPEEKFDPNAPPLMGSGAPPLKSGGGLDKYDEDLDGSSTPRTLKTHSDDEEDGESDEASRAPKSVGPAVEEQEALIRYRHTLGLSVGSFRNMSGFAIPGTTHNGFTTSYSRVIEKGVWFKESAPHDSLSLEFGAGYYARVNLVGANDNYDVLPLRTEILYTLQMNPTFAFLGWFGAQYNLIFSTENAQQEGLDALSGIQLNGGVGVLYNIGPQWYVRADLGLDRVALGLAVKW